MKSTVRRAVQAIHQTPHLMTLSFAGAGAEALHWLHSVGGSSRTILEASDHYAPQSTIEALGFEPESFTSHEVAKGLAEHAFKRAQTLKPDQRPCFGVGCTATIATDRRKRGDHRCIIAVRDVFGTLFYALTLKKGERSRAGEEQLVSLMILQAVAQACGILDYPELPLVADEHCDIRFEPNRCLQDFSQDAISMVLVHPSGKLEARSECDGIAVLPGSFNPVHEGHKTLAAVAAEMTQRKIVFELALSNADKSQIDLIIARQRAVQFLGFAPLVLTKLPLFSQKAALFPNSVFIIGADTARRLVDLRYYHQQAEERNAAFEQLREKGCSFLVAGRKVRERFVTLDEIPFPAAYEELFADIPEERFHIDISSSEIRARLQKD